MTGNNVNDYGSISPSVGVKADKRLLKRAIPLCVHQRYAQQVSHERNSGDTRVWRRYEPLSVASTAPLAEVTGSIGEEITFTDYRATLQLYGNHVKLTRKIADLHTDPVLREHVDACSEQMAQILELVAWERLKGGSSVMRAGNVASRTLINSRIDGGELRLISQALDNAYAKKFTSIIKSSPDWGTVAVEAGYYAIIHPDLASDVRDLPRFAPVAKYGSQATAQEGELGEWEDFRFVKAPLLRPWRAAATGVTSTTWKSNGGIPTTAANPDVYPILILARDAYACVRLQGDPDGNSPASIKVVNPGTATITDPHGLLGLVSWSCWYAIVITNELWMYRYEVCATAKPSVLA